MVRKVNPLLITTSGDTSGNVFAFRATNYIDTINPIDTQVNISNVLVTDVNFTTPQVNLYDTGGYIKVTGRNFDNGTTLFLGNTINCVQLAPVTFTSNTELRATVPAISGIGSPRKFTLFALTTKGYTASEPNAVNIETFKSYSLSRSANNVDEGNSFTISITTVGVSNGTNVPYSITGVSSTDIGNASLTGNFVIQNNANSIVFTVTSDSSTEGAENFAIALTNGSTANTTVAINDTSVTPTYSLSRSAASVNEGGSFTITLTTTGVNNGTSVPYTITGVASADISSASLTGNFVQQSGSNVITFTATEDLTTEGTETFTITLDGRAETISVTINDTSVAIDPNAQSVNASWFPGGFNAAPSPAPGVSSFIRKITHATDTATVSNRGSLALAVNNAAMTGDNAYGWVAGGFQPTTPSPGSTRSTIQRIEYATDTGTAASRSNMTRATLRHTSSANHGTILTQGWFAGGSSPAAATVSRVERLEFATDTNTPSIRGSLATAVDVPAASGNSTYIWVCGGWDQPSVTYYSLIQRITLAADTPTTTTRGNIDNSAPDERTVNHKSVGNADYQWVTGLRGNAAPGNSTRIQRVTYSNDTATATVRGNITGARYNAAAAGDSTYGWYVGGIGVGSWSRVDRITYSSDTATASQRGNLPNAVREFNGSSGYAA